MADPLAVGPNLIPAPEPGGEFSFTQMIPTLVFDVAMPIVAFNVLVHYGVSTPSVGVTPAPSINAAAG
jgi:hypothetical protein